MQGDASTTLLALLALLAEADAAKYRAKKLHRHDENRTSPPNPRSFHPPSDPARYHHATITKLRVVTSLVSGLEHHKMLSGLGLPQR